MDFILSELKVLLFCVGMALAFVWFLGVTGILDKLDRHMKRKDR